MVKETDFDTHSLKAVQTCLSSLKKSCPLNLPRTEVTIVQIPLGTNIWVSVSCSIGLKSPEGNLAPFRAGFPFEIFFDWFWNHGRGVLSAAFVCAFERESAKA